MLTDPDRRMLAAIEEALKIRDATGAWMPNQFSTPTNPRTHYEITGPELWEQLDRRVDAFVYGSGTGGTISDRSVVDRVIRAWDEDAFPVARRLAREEGLFVGMSSGAIAWAALEVARELGRDKRVAMISPDSGARYFSTALFDGQA